jgi:hypothetical protein
MPAAPQTSATLHSVNFLLNYSANRKASKLQQQYHALQVCAAGVALRVRWTPLRTLTPIVDLQADLEAGQALVSQIQSCLEQQGKVGARRAPIGRVRALAVLTLFPDACRPSVRLTRPCKYWSVTSRFAPCARVSVIAALTCLRPRARPRAGPKGADRRAEPHGRGAERAGAGARASHQGAGTELGW